MQDETETPRQELPPMLGAERDLVAKYPLPEGVPDALVNKNLLAAALDVSTTTIDKWLVLPEDDRIPFVERGTNGRSYVFRLSVAFAWRQAREAAEAVQRQASEDASAQLRMALTGGSIQDQARMALSPKEQAEALKVEQAWILAAHARREFIRADEAAQQFEAVLAAIRDTMDAAPDKLARELGLGGAEVEAMQKIIDATMLDAVARVEEIVSGET